MRVEKVAFISAELPYWNLVTHAVFPEYGMPLVATIVRIQRSTARWADYLESVEGYYYDDNDQLIEERLGEGIHPARYPGSTRAAGLDRATIIMGS